MEEIGQPWDLTCGSLDRTLRHIWARGNWRNDFIKQREFSDDRSGLHLR